jgi:murein L,D-transpeptidase YcbB/YkuD
MRPYTGTTDGAARGKRPGLEAFVAAIQERSGGQLWNNGTYGIRSKRGKSSLSVHATARAADISRRKYGKHSGTSRQNLEKVCDWLVEHAEDIGLEYLADYEYGNGGRGWRCDRDDWQIYRPGIIAGGGSGDWIHVEISPEKADSTDWIDAVMASFPLTSSAPAPAPADDSSYPGSSTKRGSRATARIRQIQEKLVEHGARNSRNTGPLVVDGDFGAATDAAVKAFQDARGLTVDGIVGPQTWAALFG